MKLLTVIFALLVTFLVLVMTICQVAIESPVLVIIASFLMSFLCIAMLVHTVREYYREKAVKK